MENGAVHHGLEARRFNRGLYDFGIGILGNNGKLGCKVIADFSFEFFCVAA